MESLAKWRCLHANKPMPSHLLPSSLGTIKAVAFHPSIGTIGAAYIETEHARITISANAGARQDIRIGCRVLHWAVLDLCIVIGAQQESASIASVLRHVCKSDEALRAAQIARPAECAAAARAVRSCQSLLRVSTLLTLLSPLVVSALFDPPVVYVVGITAFYGTFALVSLHMRRRWEAVCAELFCEPMIGIALN